MKILVVQEADWLTKGPHQQHHLMDRLSLKSHEIRIIDFETSWRTGKKELFSKRLVFANVSKIYEKAYVTLIRPSIIKLPFLDAFSILFSHAQEINRQIMEFKPDLIVGFGILNSHIAMKMAKKNGIPFIYYLLEELHTLVPYKFLKPLARVVESITIQKADAVLVINEKLKDYVIEMGAHPNHSYVIRAGVDSDTFGTDIDGDKIRMEYKIKKDDFVLFFMGTIFSFSGIMEAALELAKIKDKNPNVKLLIVGKARTKEIDTELKRIQEKHSLHNHLIFTGRQPYERMPFFVAASDICLLPAYNNEVMRNIVPIKLYEYMISGKPVISTKLPGVFKEFGFDNGIFYVKEPREAVKKAIELSNNIALLTKSGQKARSYVESLSWEKIVNEFETFIEKLITNNDGNAKKIV